MKAKRTKPVEGAAVEPGMVLAFTLEGPPRSKKNSPQLIPGAKFPRVLPSKAYRRWHAEQRVKFDAELRAMQDAGRVPIGRPVQLKAVFYRDRNGAGDLTNFEAGLEDFLQDVGVLVNDRFVRSKDGSRLEVDRARPRIEVTLEVLP